MNLPTMHIWEKIVAWAQVSGLNVLFIIIATILAARFLNRVIVRIVRRVVPRGSFVSASEEKKREETLIKITQNFFGVFIWIASGLGILHNFGVPVAPLITGAGILGVAIGFGSQSLVKDIINGLFIIAENQFRIGDVISIDSTDHYYGTVEGMTLRVTKIRQLDGTIHYVPNGEIKIASNKSKDFSIVDLKIGVGYDTKIDNLESIVNKVGQDLYQDPEFTDYMLEAPHFLRIDALSDYAITVRILGKVYPKQQYFIAGELRKRLKYAFEAHKIDIPYPTRVVYHKNETDK